MRHGFAGDYVGKDNVDDARKLQPDGIDAVKALAQWMASPKRNMVPNSIVCSPLRRAVETAKLMSDAFGLPYAIDQNLERSKPMEMFIKKCCGDKSIRRPLLIAHIDNIVPALAKLNYLDKMQVDAIAMAEMRVLKLDRDDCTWDEKLRVLPSDLDGVDYY